MTNPTSLDLDAIEADIAAYQQHPNLGFACCTAHPIADAGKALVAEVRRLRDAMEQIRHLHKDSPMGPCPVCIDANAAAAGGDGLVPYPCPTGRLAGAQDCDPPSVRAADKPGEACRKCRHPFNPADNRWDGSARYRETPFCRRCIDVCHESTDAFHRCVICVPAAGVTGE